MNEEKSKLSILLAQFGRQEFSNRFLYYLKSTSCKFPIIYADGDVDGFSVNLIEKYKDSLDIKLIENKQTVKFKDYFTMMVRGLSAVETEYVMLCDNDDFIIYSSINKLIHFLDNNADYISAGSPITEIQLDNYSTSCYGKYSSLTSHYKHYRDQEPLLSWNDQVEKTFLNFQPNFYHIFRKDILLKIWMEILELDFSDLTIMEFYYQLRAPTFGKQFSDPSMTHYIRQSGTGSWESKTYDFSKELVYNNLPSDIRKVANKISIICNEEFKTNQQDIYHSILDNYSKHLNNYLPHNVLRYRWPKLFKFKTFMLKYLRRLKPIINLIYYLREKKILILYKKTKPNSYLLFLDEIKTIKKVIQNS